MQSGKLKNPMENDPLLQPFRLKHLTLKNRIMTTSHESAYSDSGMPTERYAAYHEERAKAGIALAMTAGSAAVSKDSPPVFNNVLAYKDEVVPWIKQLTDRCHQHGCAVMIQLTHLGRRTNWNKGDWLPAVSSTKHREPAHHAFPKLAEDWDVERVISDFADAAERMKEGGMDGIELQVYGHLLDQFWSPLTNDLSGPYGGQTLESRMRMPLDTLAAIRERVGDEFIVGFRYTADEAQKGGITPEEGIEISKRLAATGQLDFLNVIRGRIHTDPAMTDIIQVQGMRSAPHRTAPGFCRGSETSHWYAHFSRSANSGCRHCTSCDKNRSSGYGRYDSGTHSRPAYRQKDCRKKRARYPPLCWSNLLSGSHLSGR